MPKRARALVLGFFELVAAQSFDGVGGFAVGVGFRRRIGSSRLSAPRRSSTGAASNSGLETAKSSRSEGRPWRQSAGSGYHSASTERDS